MEYPEVFVKGFTENFSETSLKADLLVMQGNILMGINTPKRFGDGCEFIAKYLGRKAVEDAMVEVAIIIHQNLKGCI